MTENLTARDQALIWHPYTRMLDVPPPVAVIRAAGVRLFCEDGSELIDAISSWWVNLHGHAHPHIAAALSAQLELLHHVLFAGVTHEPAVLLAERLRAHLPPAHRRIFYSDNGSTAVEVALKMALQFWRNQGTERRRRIVALDGSYHGDTFGAMSASTRGIFTEPFRSYLFPVDFLPLPRRRPSPDSNGEIDPRPLFENLCRGGDVAAFIFEPLVQGAAGMRMYDAGMLTDLLLIAERHEVLTIADEVMTGFGRTGTFFASDQISLAPNIMALSKGLTGGTLPLGLTSCDERVFEEFRSAEYSRTLFHGHSYTANPLACRAGIASLDLLERAECRDAIARISRRQGTFAEKLLTCAGIHNPRALGTIAAFEVGEPLSNYAGQLRDSLYDAFLRRGILLRPLGNTVYIMPPYCISDAELDRIHNAVEEVIQDLVA